MQAFVSPKILFWAREQTGLELEKISEALRVPKKTVLDWEGGKAVPSLTQMEKMAGLYKRPLAFFYLETPPVEPDQPKDFRKNVAHKGRLSMSVQVAMRRANDAQDGIHDLRREEKAARSLEMRTTVNADVEGLAIGLRKLLDVSIEEQLRAEDPNAFLKLLREKIESRDVFTLQHPMPTDEVRAFSIWKQARPSIIMLNSKDAPAARNFSLVHELSHILLREGGLCYPTGQEGNFNPVELFCNRLAAAFLLPANDVDLQLSNMELRPGAWSDAEFISTSKKFKVSKEVVLRRLHALKYITRKFLDETLERWALDFSGPTKSYGRAKPAQKAVSRAGNEYTRVILRGVAKDRLTISAATRLLGVRTKYFSRIEKIVFGKHKT